MPFPNRSNKTSTYPKSKPTYRTRKPLPNEIPTDGSAQITSLRPESSFFPQITPYNPLPRLKRHRISKIS